MNAGLQSACQTAATSLDPKFGKQHSEIADGLHLAESKPSAISDSIFGSVELPDVAHNLLDFGETAQLLDLIEGNYDRTITNNFYA